MNTSAAVAHCNRRAMGTPIRGYDKPAREVEGKVPLRRDVIERGGSSKAWYGGRARRSLPRRTVSSTPRALAAPHGVPIAGGPDADCFMQRVEHAMGLTLRDCVIS